MCKSASVYHIFFATATTNRHLFAKIKIGDGFSIVKNRHLFKKSRLGDGILWREYFYDCLAESTFSTSTPHFTYPMSCYISRRGAESAEFKRISCLIQSLPLFTNWVKQILWFLLFITFIPPEFLECPLRSLPLCTSAWDIQPRILG